jgi:hypothetical protein
LQAVPAPKPGSLPQSGKRDRYDRPIQKDDQLEKRRREQTRRQKQVEKQQRRDKRAAERRTNPGNAADKDADLAGMVPGPQPGQITD